jgi:transcriptional regulator with XRE-family HTH domain
MNEEAPLKGLPKKQPGEINPIDVHVGSRLRQRRTLVGMSQGKLGDMVGLTFQQIQKYEHGVNRIGASRLYDMSRVLDVQISYFFEDLPADVAAERYGDLEEKVSEEVSAFDTDHMARRETLELVRNYYKIDNPSIRRRVFELAKVLSGGENT